MSVKKTQPPKTLRFLNYSVDDLRRAVATLSPAELNTLEEAIARERRIATLITALHRNPEFVTKVRRLQAQGLDYQAAACVVLDEAFRAIREPS